MLQIQIIKQRTEQQIYNIHSLASIWFEKNNFIYEAVQHSLKAQDTIRAIDIIENNLTPSGILCYRKYQKMNKILEIIERKKLDQI